MRKTYLLFKGTIRCTNEIRIAMLSAEAYFTSVTFLYQTGGFFFAVMDGFISIRMSHYLPFPINFVPIPAFLAVLFMISMMMPMGAQVFELSNALLKQLGGDLHYLAGRGRLGLMKRIVKSLMPLAISSGVGRYRVFVNKRETKIAYYGSIMINVINAVLSIPQFYN